MKRIFSLILVLILFSPSAVYGHTLGQPPYFKINGVFTDYYPVPTTSLPDFKLPQDIASGTFLVNEQINFEIDVKALPIPEQVVEKTKFIWEFGDGTIAEGLKNAHTYTKPGTYYLDLKADSGEGFEPQLLQSTAIHVLPSKDYILPKSVIEVNKKQVQDPLLDLIDVNFNRSIEFDGSNSQKGTSEISEFIWDMGDQNSKQGPKFTYKYSENPYTVFPVLRVKTKDGFIVDSFVQIKDESAFEDTSSNFGLDWKMIAVAIVISIIAAGMLTWIISKFFLKK